MALDCTCASSSVEKWQKMQICFLRFFRKKIRDKKGSSLWSVWFCWFMNTPVWCTSSCKLPIVVMLFLSIVSGCWSLSWILSYMYLNLRTTIYYGDRAAWVSRWPFWLEAEWWDHIQHNAKFFMRGKSSNDQALSASCFCSESKSLCLESLDIY